MTLEAWGGSWNISVLERLLFTASDLDNGGEPFGRREKCNDRRVVNRLSFVSGDRSQEGDPKYVRGEGDPTRSVRRGTVIFANFSTLVFRWGSRSCSTLVNWWWQGSPSASGYEDQRLDYRATVGGRHTSRAIRRASSSVLRREGTYGSWEGLVS